jgi:PAS domain S-box-containing protein
MKFFVPKIDGPFTVRGTEIRPDDTPEQYLQKLARITLDEMFQLVGVLTTDGILLECNRAALVAGGLTRDDVIGKPFWETYWWTCSSKTQEDLRNAIARAARGESVRYDTEVYGRKGGTETMIMDFTLLPVMDEKGRIVFLLPEGRDITEKKAYEREIARQREELATLDVLKTQFFANVSHEFRTPLTLMLGPTEDLLRMRHGILPQEAQEQISIVHRNARRLQKLVNALLDFSRIEAGRIQASYAPTDLAALTGELASVFRSAVEKAGMRLIVDCPAMAEPIYVDRDMWEKIVLNLLSNAFKFTFTGEIAVSLEQRSESVLLSVRDTGIGIAESELPHVFERFHRVEGARGRTYEGTGIGLALVQELVKLHGGTLTATSVPDEGTMFTVSIPKGRAHLPHDRVRAERTLAPTAVRADDYVEEALRWLPEDPAAVPTITDRENIADVFGDATAHGRNASAERRPARVLLADDNADMRSYVGRLLAQRYVVDVVADGEAALAAVEAARPDLIVTDVMMSKLDGFGLLRKLRADERTRTIPVLFLSARAGEEARIEGLEAGADDYLTKPFSARELVARVAAHLEMARVREEADRVAESANRAKDEFLAMLGHELRNPLSPILTALQLMKLRGGASERERMVIERQVSHMTRLVDDLLDVSRIAHGQVDLKQQVVEIADLVAQAVEMSSPLLEQGAHELVLDVRRRGLAVEGDPTRLSQVIANLLTNSAKYTPRGGRISVHAVEEGDHVVLRVNDTGIGIAPDVLPRVFDLFVQERQALDRSQGGLGLGLAIVRNLVERHGGQVSAHSDGPGRGSTFVVRLPRVESSTGIDEADSVPTDGSPVTVTPTNDRRVLIVEDSEDGAEMLSEFLRMQGYETRVALNGLEGLKVAEAFAPHIVLVDIGLPVMDGYELAAHLQQLSGLNGARLIALTGYGQDSDRSKTRAAGFHAHLVKPIDFDALEQVLVNRP